MRPNSYKPLQLAILYLFIGTLWLLAGDWLLQALSSSSQLHTLKNLSFLLGSTLLITWLAVRQQHLKQDHSKQETEQRFNSTFEQSVVGIAQLSLDGEWLRVNERFCSMLGYSRDELLKCNYFALSYPEDLPAERLQAQRLQNGEIEQFSLEKRFRSQQGEALWARMNASLVPALAKQPAYFLLVIEDITRDRQQTQALQQAAAVFDSAHEAVAIVDVRRRVLSCNPAFCAMTGWDPKYSFGQRLSLPLQSSEDRHRYRDLWQQLSQQGRWQGELNTRRQDGSLLPLWLTASLVRDGDPDDPQYALVFSDLSPSKENQARMTHLANYDALTGLPNRQFALTRLSHVIGHAQRHEEKLAVLLLDIDGFKTLNDGLGLPVGDELLIAISRRLQERLRQEDTLARLGGDEFLVLIEDIRSPEDVALVARALLKLFDAPITLSDEREIYLGGCVGISIYPHDGTNADELLRNADSALNQAKAEGRRSYRYYTQALTERANLRLSLESRLRKALKQGEFQLHYQPLLNVSSGQPFGVEALLRWQSDEGRVSPAEFIPIAEDTGLIIPIGGWVLREACRQAAQWRSNGLPLTTLAINLSPRQFRKNDLIDNVRDALLSSGLPAHCLELEITEGALIEDVEQARNILNGLKELGVKLSVDDFGTGYSSLGYLRSFPLDKLKIDQSFLRGVPAEGSNLEIVSTIIGLARNLELKVLAEGVETPAQLQVLRELNCLQCQGFLFSPALDATELPLRWQQLSEQASNQLAQLSLE